MLCIEGGLHRYEHIPHPRLMHSQRIEQGPDSFVTYKPAAMQLIRELGLDDQVVGTNPERKNVFVAKDGQLVQMPVGVRLAVPTDAWAFLKTPLISTRGKLRMFRVYDSSLDSTEIRAAIDADYRARDLSHLVHS